MFTVQYVLALNSPTAFPRMNPKVALLVEQRVLSVFTKCPASFLIWCSHLQSQLHTKTFSDMSSNFNDAKIGSNVDLLKLNNRLFASVKLVNVGED